jgi:peptidoglycan/LPS O-acetylase OafA/YrhL
MPPARRYFISLDGIRGVAAIAIVMLHAKRLLFGNGISVENFLAVDIFFILSGVVITNAYEHRLQSGLAVREFIKIRLIRLYPLYILGTVIGLYNVLAGFSHDDYTGYLPLGVVLALMMLPDPTLFLVFPFNPPAWSLFYELLVNIVYAAVFRFLTLRVLAAIMAVSALGLAVILVFGHDHNLSVGWNAKSFSGGLVRVAYSFFAGVLLYRLFARRILVLGQHWWTGLMPWIILGVVALVLGAIPPAAVRPYYEFAVVVFLFPAVVYCALWVKPEGVSARVCKVLGSVSYAVYAIHYPLYWLFHGMITKLTNLPAETFAPWAGFCFIGVLVPFCWVLDKFYDGPLRKFLLKHGRSKLAAVPEKA